MIEQAQAAIDPRLYIFAVWLIAESVLVGIWWARCRMAYRHASRVPKRQPLTPRSAV